MKDGLRYKHQFVNVEGKTVTTYIYDTYIQIEDDDVVQTLDLIEADDPLHLSTVDNDEEKFTPIKAKRLTIRFLSTQSYNIGTFSSGPDDRFKVTSQIENTIIFYGFLSLNNNREGWMPHSNVVTLIATDKLGALKDIDWTTDLGENPEGKYRIAEIVALCLKKTGLSLPIKVVNNVRHGSGVRTFEARFDSILNEIMVDEETDFFYENQEFTVTGTFNNNSTFHASAVTVGGGVTAIGVDENITTTEIAVAAVFTDTSSGHLYDKIYLDAKTFEKEIGLSEDCYTVLEKILKEDCFITQWLGEWWIMRVDEFEDTQIYVTEFNSDGDFVEFEAATTYNKTIGPDDDLWFSHEQTEITQDREHGFVKEEFEFETPLEIVCNIDFARGDLITEVSETQKHFELECWTLYRNVPPATPIGNEAYIRKIYSDTGYEVENFAVIDIGDTNDFYYLESEPIYVQESDRFDFNVDLKYNGQVLTGAGPFSTNAAQIRLYAEDGTRYTFNAGTSVDEAREWTLASSDFSTGSEYYVIEGDGDDDDTIWRSVSQYGTARDTTIPKSGYLTILLIASRKTNEFETHFGNLTFDYIPFVDGVYRKLRGQYHRIDRAVIQYEDEKETGYLAKREGQVYISDSPKPLYKGSMYFLSDSSYKLSHHFYLKSVLGSGEPTDDRYHPFGYIQVFSVWNQFRNANSIFYYKLNGGYEGSTATGFLENPPDLLHKFSINEDDPMSSGRYFMLLTFDHDLKLCESTGTLIEVYRTDLKKYGDVYEFKYKSE